MENDKLRSSDSLHKKAKYVLHFLMMGTVKFLIATFRLKKTRIKLFIFITLLRFSKKFVLSRKIAREIDSLMDCKCLHCCQTFRKFHIPS